MLHIVQVRIFFGQRNNFVIPAAKTLLQKFLQRLLAALRQLGTVKPQQKLCQLQRLLVELLPLERLARNAHAALLQNSCQLLRSLLSLRITQLRAGHEQHIALAYIAQKVRALLEHALPLRRLLLRQQRLAEGQKRTQTAQLYAQLTHERPFCALRQHLCPQLIHVIHLPRQMAVQQALRLLLIVGCQLLLVKAAAQLVNAQRQRRLLQHKL